MISFSCKKQQNKKRSLCIFLTIVTIICSLTGCSNLEFPWNEATESGKISLDDNVSSDVIIVERVEVLDEKDEIEELPETDFSAASKELVQSDGLKYYAYDQLSDEEKILYTEIYSILENLASDTKVSSKDPDEIDKAFNYVMLDHPEIFYITGYSFTKYMRGDKIEKITLSGNYTMSANQVAEKRLLIDAYADKCLAGYDGPVDDYEKVKYIYEYLIKNTSYDMSAPNNQNILSVAEEGRTVCQGYAKMMQLLLNKMGVFCILCEGVVKGTESHVWNIVKIDDEYYQLDATWGDASYQIDEEYEDFKAPEINYDYLCITDEVIGETHVFRNSYEIPTCSSMKDNYYVREGLYLTELDTAIISAAFDNARAKGETIVTLKCANANVYSALYNHLVENHGIFDYLNGSQKVNYVQFRNDCRISFYI